MADRVPPPPRRRAGDRRRRRRAGAPRCAPPSWAPTSCCATTAPSPAGALLAEGGHERARELAARARAAGVEVLARRPRSASSTGSSRSGRATTLHQIRAGAHVVATGAIEQPLVFEGNDLPGVMLCRRRAAPGRPLRGRARRRRGGRHHGRPRARGGARPARRGRRSRRRRRPAPDAAGARSWRAHGGAEVLLPGATVVARPGARRAAVPPARRRPRRSPSGERAHRLRPGRRLRRRVPATLAARSRPAPARYDEARGALRRRPSCPRGMHAAGAVAGHEDAEAAELSGALAGAEAALALGLGDERRPARGRARGASGARAAPRPRRPPAATAPGRGKCFACLCEDVTTKDIELRDRRGLRLARALQALHDGDHGPLPGSDVPARRRSALMAERHRASSSAEVGLTTARPPWSTVPMGVLAGRPFEPAKRSAVHGRHRELGGNVLWAGDWRRPYDYGDPQARDAGRARGRRADRRLDPRQADRARPGGRAPSSTGSTRTASTTSSRAGSATGCSAIDAGRITDDGTICRLDDESFYVTTTSSGADAVEEWFAWWLADWDMDVHAHRRHPGRSPPSTSPARARGRSSAGLTDLDCSNEAFPYLDGKQAQVAGRARACCCGSASSASSATRSTARRRTAEHLWDALLEAGAATASAPSASSRSGSCACRSCTSSSARTPTPSRRRSTRRCPGSSSSTRRRTSSAAGRSSTSGEQPARDRAGRLHDAPTARCPTEGAAVRRRQRRRRPAR